MVSPTKGALLRDLPANRPPGRRNFIGLSCGDRVSSTSGDLPGATRKRQPPLGCSNWPAGGQVEPSSSLFTPCSGRGTRALATVCDPS